MIIWSFYWWTFFFFTKLLMLTFLLITLLYIKQLSMSLHRKDDWHNYWYDVTKNFKNPEIIIDHINLVKESVISHLSSRWILEGIYQLKTKIRKKFRKRPIPGTEPYLVKNENIEPKTHFWTWINKILYHYYLTNFRNGIYKFNLL